MTRLTGRKFIHTFWQDAKGIALFLLIIWIAFAFDRALPLEMFGLIPRSLSGLPGIIALPLLHVDLRHIISNTVPLAVLLLLLAGSRANSALIVIFISLLGGTLLWLFGRSALHIGASVLVFGLIGFLLFAGVFERRVVSIIISLVVVSLYGSTLLFGVLPLQRGVSWEGHLFGAIAGVLVALCCARGLRSG